MKIKALHPNFKLPVKGTALAGGIDLFMPTDGTLYPNANFALEVPLGFAAEVPEGYVALVVPRSGVGCKAGLELNNTVGVIDSDYRGEWKAFLRIKNSVPFSWKAGDRLLQMLIVPVANVDFELVTELTETDRGTGGWGSTGK